MPYVERNIQNEIIGLYARPQPGKAEEKLPDNDPEIIAFTNPLTTLTGAIFAKKEAINILYLEKATAPFTHGGKIFDATKEAQDNIHAAISYGQLNSILDATNRTWVLTDNITATLTWGEFRAMASALFERADALHGYARAHKDAIGALATVAAVDAYDINTSWGI